MKTWLNRKQGKENCEQSTSSLISHLSYLKCKTNARFTLVELLIVVAIIAILAGMLLPALNSAREKARSISCLSKIKQVNLEMNMYADSHDDYLPPRGYHAQKPDAWTIALGVPTTDRKAGQKFVCPTLEVKNHNPVATLAEQVFGLNIRITGESDNSTANKTYKKRGRIIGSERTDFVANTTSGVMLFGDSIYTTYSGTFGSGADANSPVQYFGIAYKYGTAGNGAVHFRHSGDTANFGMLDGSGANMNFASAYKRSCVTAGYTKGFTLIQQALE